MTAMNGYLAQVIQQQQPSDNDLRVGTVVADDGGAVRVNVNGGVLDCGYLRSYEPFSGDTVAVLRQESGWLVLGSIQGPASPAGEDAVAASGVVGGCYYTGGTAALSAAGAETIMTAWTAADTLTFQPGQLYLVKLAYGYYDSAGVNHLIDFRLRKGFTTGSQLLGVWRRTTVSGLASQVQMTNAEVYVKNATGSAITASLGLAAQRMVGTGNVGIYGDATYVMSLTLEHVGTIAANATLAGIAGSIT